MKFGRKWLLAALSLLVAAATVVWLPGEAEATPHESIEVRQVLSGDFVQGSDLAAFIIYVKNTNASSIGPRVVATFHAPSNVNIFSFGFQAGWGCQFGSSNSVVCTRYSDMPANSEESFMVYAKLDKNVPLTITYPVQVVTNSGSNVNDFTLSAPVTNVEYRPELQAIGTQSSAEGDIISLQASAIDWDGDAFTYSATGLPDGITIDTASGLISGELDYDTEGSYAVQVGARDATNRTHQQSFTWNVAHKNRLPAFTADAANKSQTIHEGEGLAALAAADADGTALTFSAEGELPDGITLNSDGTFSGTATSVSSGVYTPTISVSDGEDTVDEELTIAVVNRAELSIEKSHEGNFWLGQTGVQYSIVVRNAAGAGDTDGDVVVQDILPSSDLTATAISGGGWNCDLASLRCVNSSTLGGGQSYEPITVTADVLPGAGGNTVNEASVSGGGDLTPDDNVASDETIIERLPDMKVEMESSGSGFREGGSGTYTLKVLNAGSLASSGTIALRLLPPAGLTVTNMDGGPGWSCDPASFVCTTDQVLGIGEYASDVVVAVSVANDTASTVIAVAQVEHDADRNSVNDEAELATPIAQAADLAVVLETVGTFRQGEAGQFRMTVSNDGEGSTNGVVTVTDTLPAGITATGYNTGAGWSCTLGATVVCTTSDVLAAGDSYPALLLDVDVSGNAAAQLENTVDVSGGGDVTAGNNSEQGIVVIVQNLDVAVVVMPSGVFGKGQSGAAYVAKVSNIGTGETSGAVKVDFTLPNGISASALTANGWSCDVDALTCGRSDTLAAGALYDDILLEVEIDEEAAEPAVATVAITASGDVNAVNNSASYTAPIVSTLTIAENNAPAASLGKLTTDSRSFNIVEGYGDDELFEVIGDELFATSSLDYESTDGLAEIRVKDAATNKEQTLFIGISDVNEAPTALSLSASSMNEELPVGTEVGVLASINPEPDENVQYSLADGTGSEGNSSFAIAGDKLITADVLDYEAAATRSIRVRVTDTANQFYEQTFVVTVLNMNDNAPTAHNVAFATNFLTTGNGQLIGHDKDGDVLAFSVVEQGTKGTLTVLDSATGQFSYTPLEGEIGTDTVTYAVNDGVHPAVTAEVNVTILPVGIADLKGLSVSAGELRPAFAEGTTSYSLNVSNSTTSTSVTANAKDIHADITVNGVSVTNNIAGDPISLKEGNNTITIVVTTQDGSTNTYTVTIKRAASSGGVGGEGDGNGNGEGTGNGEGDGTGEEAGVVDEPETPTTPTKPGPTPTFSDVAEHWAAANIKEAVNAGIVGGYPDGTFRPNHTVTRAEFAVMIMNALRPASEGSPLTFSDTTNIAAWAQRAVGQALQAGIIHGYEDGSFRPNSPITRSEMAAIIASAMKLSIEKVDATGFADNDTIPAWARGAVEALHQLGLIQGKGDNAFDPSGKTTRAEAITVLLKMLALQRK